MDKTSKFSNNTALFLGAVFCALLWGSAFPVLKISFEELQIPSGDIFSTVTFAGIRFFIAAWVVYFLMLVLTKNYKLKWDKNNSLWIALLAFLGTFMQYFLFYNGLANTTGVKGSILATSGTFFVIIFARTVYPEDRLNRNKIIGLFLGALGIFMVNWTTDMASSLTLDFNFFGEGFIILTGISSAMATLIAKKLSAENSSFHLTFWQMLIGSILLLAVGITGGGGFDLEFTPLAAVLLIYSAFASGVAFTIWYELLQYHDASKVTVYKFLIPVFGSILSILFLPGESFQILIVLGLVSATLGIYFVNKPKNNI